MCDKKRKRPVHSPVNCQLDAENNTARDLPLKSLTPIESIGKFSPVGDQLLLPLPCCSGALDISSNVPTLIPPSTSPFWSVKSKPLPAGIFGEVNTCPDFIVGSSIHADHKFDFIRSAFSQVSAQVQSSESSVSKSNVKVFPTIDSKHSKYGDIFFSLLKSSEYRKRLLVKLGSETVGALQNGSLLFQDLSSRDRYVLRQLYQSYDSKKKKEIQPEIKLEVKAETIEWKKPADIVEDFPDRSNLGKNVHSKRPAEGLYPPSHINESLCPLPLKQLKPLMPMPEGNNFSRGLPTILSRKNVRILIFLIFI